MALLNLPGSPSYKELQIKFGSSKELIESSRNVISGDMLSQDISSCVEAAKQVAAYNYKVGTCWGQEVLLTDLSLPEFCRFYYSTTTHFLQFL
jgi:hypothetical protein